MKRFLCYLAQLRSDSTDASAGWLGRHVQGCAHCRSFFEQVRDIEQGLSSPPAEVNEESCEEILRAVDSLPRRAPNVSGSRRRLRPALIGSVALVVLTVLAVAVFSSRETGREEPMVTNEPVESQPSEETPEPSPPKALLLADAKRQQELLRRDVEKLRAHLRENVILFQAN